MLEILSGLGLLILMLGVFSLFSFKAPKGDKAMSGMANAAVVTFLIEAIHRYIFGDIFNIQLLQEVGTNAGGMGGVAAAILVPVSMGVNPIYSAVAGMALSGYGILPGFIAGYAIGLLAPYLEKKLPRSLSVIVGSLIIAPIAWVVASVTAPYVETILKGIGGSIEAATTQHPLFMGFILGGIIKVICTSPLSSMALTAMLNMTGLPMGIAAIACFGGSFTNGMIFKKLKLGDSSNIVAVMLEPLTQADIVTKNAVPIYCSNFFGGAIAGVGAAVLGIVNNAPGTASPIPGMIAPFAFNSPGKVCLALLVGAIGGTIAGYIGGLIFSQINNKKALSQVDKA